MMKSTIMAGVALVALALAACSGAGGTPAPTSEADKLKLANEIATLMSDPKMIDDMFGAMQGSMMPNLAGICEAAPEAERATCAARVAAAQPSIEAGFTEGMDQARAMMPEMMSDMGAIMARLYTGEELATMRDFYASPEGKSIMQKQPKVMEEYMPKVMARMQSMQAEMVRNIQKRVQDAVGAPPPPN
jgi:hypothetical protein